MTKCRDSKISIFESMGRCFLEPYSRWTMLLIRTLGVHIRTSLVCDVIQNGGLLTFL